MIIKRLTASFGKLNGDTLELKNGLNIIRAPNESGKSTWCAFIKAMLYGINTSERDRQDYLSDKNKFAPWSGAPMSGQMEVTHGGRDITISRSALGGAPMKNFTAVYSQTAQSVPGLDGNNAGEVLTGASEKVYERTAFIRQSGMRISQTSELEKRIAALVSSGSEQRSYSETDEDLRSWMRKLRYRKSGIIPKLEEERSELINQYRLLEEKTESLSRLRQEMIRTQEAKDKLSDELELHRKIEKRSMLRSLSEAKIKEKRADEDIQRISSEIGVNGHIPTKEELAEIRQKCSTMDSLNVLYVKSAEAVETAKKELDSLEQAFLNTDFYKKYGDDDSAVSKASHISGYIEPQPEPEPKPPVLKKYTPQIVLFGLITLLGLALGVGGYTFYPAAAAFAPAGLAAGAAGLILTVLFIVKRAKSKAAVQSFVMPEITDPMDEYYQVFGVSSLDELKDIAGSYLSSRSDYQKALASYDAAKKAFADAESSVKAAENLVLSEASRVMSNVSDPYSVLSDLTAVESALEALTKAKFEKLSSQNIKETLSENISEDPGVSENELLPVPVLPYETALSKFEEVSARYDSIQRQYNVAYGELKAIGDPAVLNSKISSISQEIKDKELIYESLELAHSAMSDANTELQTRFSPVISKKAGEYMSVLTGGRYSDIVFDKAFNAMAKSSGEVVSRSILSLSEGTADQIYLSLRLAMSSLILSGDEPAPIILDDTLVNFDNIRMGHAIRLLKQMGEERQIILFTCHNREVEFASNDLSINTILFGEYEEDQL